MSDAIHWVMLLMPKPVDPEDERLATRAAQLIRSSHIPKVYLSSPTLPHLRRFLEQFGDAPEQTPR